MRQIMVWTCMFVFLWGCSVQISVDDHGLFLPQEKASLIDFVKGHRSIMLQKDSFYGLERFPWRFGGLLRLFFIILPLQKTGSLKSSWINLKLKGPSAKPSSPMRYFMDSREAISIFPTERNTPGLQREQLSLWLLSLQERIKFWRNFLGIKKNLSWKTLMPVAGSGIIV
jgi:hypothetical protein